MSESSRRKETVWARAFAHGTPRLRIGLAGLALAALVAAAGPLAAQEDEEEPRRFPQVTAGTPVVILPLQSARPTAGGAWPGGTTSQDDAIETLEAELGFAFGEQRGAESFVLPEQVESRARRNPLAKVDPARLSYQGLIGEPEPRAQIYEPLHSQLRRLGALFDARLAVLPLALWFEAEPPPAPDTTEAGADPAAAGADAEGAAGRGAERASAAGGAVATGAREGRAVLLFAVIDVRRSAVLWHGEIEGDVAERDSPTLLTSLAFRVARQLSPS